MLTSLHLLHRMSSGGASKSAGAIGDVQNLGGCQAPVAPMLTKALVHHLIRTYLDAI